MTVYNPTDCLNQVCCLRGVQKWRFRKEPEINYIADKFYSTICVSRIRSTRDTHGWRIKEELKSVLHKNDFQRKQNLYLVLILTIQ